MRSSVPSGDAAVSVMRGPSSSGADRFGGGPEVSLQRVEPVGPLEAVGLQPGIELHQRLRSQAIEAALGVAPHLDEAGVAQHLQVARHSGLVHPHLVDKLPDGPLAAPYRIEDATTGRLRDHVEDGKARAPREHTSSIYMCKQIFGGERSACERRPEARRRDGGVASATQARGGEAGRGDRPRRTERRPTTRRPGTVAGPVVTRGARREPRTTPSPHHVSSSTRAGDVARHLIR